MAGVYISWPFCAQKCTYCNFASGVFPRDLEQQYLDALTREIRSTIWGWRPETVYLGGGTPASMEPEVLSRVLELVPGAPWVEATIEAAPGAISREQVQAWVRLGLNRVSLGVQSFVETELRRTGRKHTARHVAEDVAMLRSEGISEINIDLIAGLPGQTARGWESSLDHVESLDPPHVSVYMLEVDEDSRLGKELLLGGVRYGAMDVPGEQQIVECYEQAVERLAQMGLARYEISNFARPGSESTHNLKYWKLLPYLGFGADAHSFDGRLRWQNVESPAEYAKAGDPRLEPVEAILAEERFFVGLRLMEGVHPTTSEWAEHRAVIEQFVADGLLEADGATLRLTPRGILLSNEVFEEFIHA
ncbi:radical SAM family heme chaperone HemW [uncultured Paludibaculum sp.]|uniref:radical SAM family heme chaperone HemW n=1 Tax=uncultured Paludibaculum sp. TaxID=1765020 RepID=UPI002AAA67FB|nr:radical SAM family heme chaperone HemW [uncultured Paludibaculum sp.]